MHTQWIRSPQWDGFWFLSGFWVPTLLLLLPLASSQSLIVWVTLCTWIAHRLSSLYLALCVGEYRAVLQAKPGYFFRLPLLLGLVLMGFVLAPESLIPIPRLERFLLLGLGDYCFSLYHFAVQHYGILSVYRSKLPHGQKDPQLLKYDWWMCIGVSGLFSLIMDGVNGELSHLLGLPAPPLWVQAVFPNLQLGLTLVILSVWGLLMRRYVHQQQGWARMLYVSSLCYMTLVSLYVSPLLYFAMAQIQHWLVSLGLTTHMAHNSRVIPNGWYRPWAWINRRAWGPLLLLILLSLSLTPILEADYYIAYYFNAESLTIPDFLPQFKDSLWIYLFGGLAFFTSFLHYIYDRGVFRFSDPVTRTAALSLLRPSTHS